MPRYGNRTPAEGHHQHLVSSETVSFCHLAKGVSITNHTLRSYGPLYTAIATGTLSV